MAEITRILIFLGLFLTGILFLYFKIAFTFFIPLKALQYCQHNCTFGANTEVTIIHDDKENNIFFIHTAPSYLKNQTLFLL